MTGPIPHPLSLRRGAMALTAALLALSTTAASAAAPPPARAGGTGARRVGDQLFDTRSPARPGDELFDDAKAEAQTEPEAPSSAPSAATPTQPPPAAGAPVYPEVVVMPPPQRGGPPFAPPPPPARACRTAVRYHGWALDPDRKPAGYGPAPPPVVRGPRTLEYEPGSAVPPGYQPDSRRRRGPLIAGAVIFGAAWLSSAAFAALVERAEHDPNLTVRLGDGTVRNAGATALYAPLVGPFIALGTMEPDLQVGAALVADGLIQSAGVALFAYGLLSREPVLVRVGKADIQLRAGATPMGDGLLGVAGRF